MNKGQFKKGHQGYWAGKKMSKEHRDKIAKGNTGSTGVMPEGYVPWNKGMNMSLEHREKLSKAHLGQTPWNKLNRTPEEFREVKREYRRKNKAQFKAYDHKKRLRRSTLTIETVQRVYEDNIKKYGTLTCYLCLEPIPFGKDHLEHKTPLSRGGTNEYYNLGVACQKCNCKKHNKTVKEYKEYMEVT